VTRAKAAYGGGSRTPSSQLAHSRFPSTQTKPGPGVGPYSSQRIGGGGAPPLADRFIWGIVLLDYSPVLLLVPFGFHLTVNTLPSGVQQAAASGASRRSCLCPAFAFVPFRPLHAFRFLRPARLLTPLLDMAPLI